MQSARLPVSAALPTMPEDPPPTAAGAPLRRCNFSTRTLLVEYMAGYAHHVLYAIFIGRPVVVWAPLDFRVPLRRAVCAECAADMLPPRSRTMV